jgi:hypothetical protein
MTAFIDGLHLLTTTRVALSTRSDVPEPLYPTHSMWAAKLKAVEQKLLEETAKCQELASSSNGIAEVT